MRRFVIFLSVLFVFCKLYSIKEIKDIEIRADYIIDLMEKYKAVNGIYPRDVNDILITYDTGYMMVNSDDIPGRGYFILYDGTDRDEYGVILVVGGYNPPNVIYFSKINKKEVNSDYFNDGSYYGISAVLVLSVMLLVFILFCVFLFRYIRKWLKLC